MDDDDIITIKTSMDITETTEKNSDNTEEIDNTPVVTENIADEKIETDNAKNEFTPEVEIENIDIAVVTNKLLENENIDSNKNITDDSETEKKLLLKEVALEGEDKIEKEEIDVEEVKSATESINGTLVLEAEPSEKEYSETILSENEGIEIMSEELKLPEEEVDPSGNFADEIDSREIVISGEGLSLETGLEIKYTSLQLKEFPISYSNFPSRLTFDEIISIGTTSIKIGNETFNNVALKILVYSKFKLLEIKTREFKLALSIDLTDEQTLVKKDDFFKYEIFSKLKTSRFTEVINLFKKIFSGEIIEFKYNKLMGNISFENRIEVYKFTVLSESIDTYKEIVKELFLHRERNIGEMKDSFYTLFLTGSSLKKEKLSSWINFRIPNNYNVSSGDTLIFERIHKLKLNGIPFDLKERIQVLEPITQREITTDNEICCYRKAVEISLEHIKKSDMKR